MKKPTLPDTIDWPDETIKWFDTWRNSPRTDGWDELQWQYLIESAVVHAEVFASGNTSMLGELHRRESYMGVTFDQKQAPKHSEKTSILQLVINDRANKAERAKNAS